MLLKSSKDTETSKEMKTNNLGYYLSDLTLVITGLPSPLRHVCIYNLYFYNSVLCNLLFSHTYYGVIMPKIHSYIILNKCQVLLA